MCQCAGRCDTRVPAPLVTLVSVLSEKYMYTGPPIYNTSSCQSLSLNHASVDKVTSDVIINGNENNECKEKGNQITTILAFRDKDSMIYLDEFKELGNVIVTTDDGSYGITLYDHIALDGKSIKNSKIIY